MTVIDVDEVAKGIYSKNPGVLTKIGELFGNDVFNSRGGLDFRLLAGKVFSDKNQLDKLNKLMFPLIKSEVREILAKKLLESYKIVDAAVLFGCGLDEFCDFTVLVESSEKRREKYLRQSGLPEDEIKLKVEGQHIKINKDKVDFIINNDGSKEDLFLKVGEILKNI